MITLFTILLVFWIFRLTGFALRATWSITKWILVIFVLPAILIPMVIGGLVAIALPLLIIAVLGSVVLPFVKGFISSWR